MDEVVIVIGITHTRIHTLSCLWLAGWRAGWLAGGLAGGRAGQAGWRRRRVTVRVTHWVGLGKPTGLAFSRSSSQQLQPDCNSQSTVDSTWMGHVLLLQFP